MSACKLGLWNKQAHARSPLPRIKSSRFVFLVSFFLSTSKVRQCLTLMYSAFIGEIVITELPWLPIGKQSLAETKLTGQGLYHVTKHS